MRDSAHSRILKLAMVGIAIALGAGRPARPEPEPPCNPFRQVSNRTAELPATLPDAPAGGAVVMGYVADSATRNGLVGAVIRLRRIDGISKDSAVTHTDSSGGFAIRIPNRGRYQYDALSVNFRAIRDSIYVKHDVETLRVVMRRGIPLCNVRLTTTGVRAK